MIEGGIVNRQLQLLSKYMIPDDRKFVVPRCCSDCRTMWVHGRTGCTLNCASLLAKGQHVGFELAAVLIDRRCATPQPVHDGKSDSGFRTGLGVNAIEPPPIQSSQRRK